MTGAALCVAVAAVITLAGHGVATLEPLADRIRVALSLGMFGLAVLWVMAGGIVVAVGGGA